MFEFVTGLFIGKTFIVPNIQNCVIQTMKKLEHYKNLVIIMKNLMIMLKLLNNLIFYSYLLFLPML